MGLNQNKGQKIMLRLRTDDLKVFIIDWACHRSVPVGRFDSIERQ